MHVMIDIEALGQGVTGHILSIGAVKFDKTSLGCRTFYVVLAHGQPGRTIDGRTTQWWMNQSQESRDAIWGKGIERVPLPSALGQLRAFCAGCQGIWANPAAYDLSMLTHAAHQSGVGALWKRQHERCARTMKTMHPAKSSFPKRKGVHHNALDDAIYQAQWMQCLL